MISTIQNSIFPTSASLQYDVKHKTAASVRQQQEGKSHQRPAQGNAPAPAACVAAYQQTAKYKPRQQGEYGFMVHGYQFVGKRQGHHRPGNNRKRQDDEAGADQAEQQNFLNQQGGHGFQSASQHAAGTGWFDRAVQVTVQGCHEHGLEGSHGNQAIGGEGDKQVNAQPVAGGVRHIVAAGK